ncbi:MAG TPA: uroporphyrinogen-III synthase [Symbiobacteriaceae bacterium]|nr:uroporphyrinogen-III synthase [Symbiobacteriaceae bacterium]
MPNHRPLEGVCVLVTRARSQAAALVDLIEAQGGEVFAFPVLSIADPESWAPLDEAIAHSDRYRWVVLTSPNGAEKFAARVAAAGKAPGGLAPLKVAAVGATTAQALERLGFAVDLVPPEFRGAALPAAMAPHLAPGDGVLMARANLADPALAENLRALGARVDDVVAYRTVSDGGDVDALKAKLTQRAIDYVTLTSSSSVANLLERLGGPQPLAGARIAVIGPETKKAAEAAGLTVHVVARQATVDGLVNSIVEDRLR